jgi:ABC-type transport system substrate-binding protein
MKLELLSVDVVFKRIDSGEFDAVLADVTNGPTMVRPSLFWRTGAPNNWGHYSNPRVDAAFDAMRYASDDVAYKAGLADYERAMVEDPPAIFLAWSERARAVSSRFLVPADPGRDILRSLAFWRPLTAPEMTNSH